MHRLITAVEGLKQHPPVTDNKTAFWTAYQTLADEYAKETQRKYGNDLDTALIFAGLFSAVSSAFIIQIQPELQPTSELTGTTLTLLTLLAQNITSVPTSTTPSSSSPPTVIVVAQGFLYFSLFSTLLAALLAVLGKQWLLHYDSVGERGTIAERGLEHQHKFDGMQHWKFDLAMQMFPLLLQFALLLFAIGLSTYLWTINHAIAGLVLGLTALGCILYTAMVVSAMKSDSPFQTPLTRLLNIVVAKFILPTAWHDLPGCAHHIWDHIPLHRSTPSVLSPPLSPHNGRSNWDRVQNLFANLRHFLVQIWTVLVTSGSSPASGVSLQSSASIFNNIPPPSPECSAVVWVLETSTNPLMVQSAAALVPDLQWWPLSLNIGPSKQRLVNALESCRSGDMIPANMETQASLCAKALILLNLVDSPQSYPHISFPTGNQELNSLLQACNISSLSWNSFTPTHWSLRALAGQGFTTRQFSDFIRHVMDKGVEDQSAFAEVLFCLNVFFLPALPCDHSVVDKSPHIIPLTAQLFRNLVRYLAETKKPWYYDLTMMLWKIAKLARGKGYYSLVDSLEISHRQQ
ncbi:hypothetical protein B0H16DRAFT_1566368 [Mycena metata]|uniref:DUF6535 domain-containing protein n=1 Tax=Mycena metata TaxID=1033252 RepID=A0AAD7IDU1_9AGAR|nr:hypothetical protein B0H16DRAFT_1566368 [Mycena metata]